MVATRLSVIRQGLTVILAALVMVQPSTATESSDVTITVAKRPACGCCDGWVEHLKRNGFRPHVSEAINLKALKVQLGVPRNLASCHTAQVSGYVIEGHVPADAIKRLLAEKPDAIGLAVPGMPIGSPGMEGGAPETYDVILITRYGQQSYGRYRTDKRIADPH